MFEVEVIETSDLGDRSYVAHDGTVAIVVDPQRDIDRVESVLADRGLRCVCVVETHVHNDYVTGGYVLAQRSGATYVLNAADEVDFDRHAIGDGDTLTFGDLTLTAMATPGHTDTHLSYLVEPTASPAVGTGGTAAGDAASEAPAVFTGGSLLYGSVGRTDLVSDERTEELTRAQFHSARKLAALPGDARVFPSHGFGSFCSSGSAAGGDSSTIAEERSRNDALVEDDENTFVKRLIANLTAYPAYYAHMGALNRNGPGPIDLSLPQLADAEQIRKRIDAGEWVVDLRNRVAYAAQHIDGTIGIELGGQFSTYLGWLIPWGSPLTLLGESKEQVHDAQRQLVRIGIDRPDAAAIGTPDELGGGNPTRSYPRATFADLAKTDRDTLTVLDVRRDDERADGHIPGSVHVPLHSLLKRMAEVPDGSVWVHCASGFRASIAASILARAGQDVVHIDDEYANVERLNLG